MKITFSKMVILTYKGVLIFFPELWPNSCNHVWFIMALYVDNHLWTMSFVPSLLILVSLIPTLMDCTTDVSQAVTRETMFV